MKIITQIYSVPRKYLVSMIQSQRNTPLRIDQLPIVYFYKFRKEKLQIAGYIQLKPALSSNVSLINHFYGLCSDELLSVLIDPENIVFPLIAYCEWKIIFYVRFYYLYFPAGKAQKKKIIVGCDRLVIKCIMAATSLMHE